MATDIELVVMTMTFDATDPTRLAALLSKYVVLARGAPGCRNIDLLSSQGRPGRFLVVSKWDGPDEQRAHLDSTELVELAEGCRGLLQSPPRIDVYDAISAHDLN
jgi:quinol monooxygenase YgiN